MDWTVSPGVVMVAPSVEWKDWGPGLIWMVSPESWKEPSWGLALYPAVRSVWAM